MRDGEVGFVVARRGGDGERADVDSLAEVVIRVLDDPEAARAQVSQSASRLIDEHFTIAAVGDKHLDVLEKMRSVGSETSS